MQYLYEWAENLAFYMILMTAVQHILPKDTYRGYIRFFSGLVMVLMLMTPILDLFGMKGDLWRAYEREEMLQMRQIEEQLADYMDGFGKMLPDGKEAVSGGKTQMEDMLPDGEIMQEGGSAHGVSE